MAEYRENPNGAVVERRSSAGPVVLGVIIIGGLVVAFLFATGFWSAKVTKDGALPTVSMKATGGAMPGVDLSSKKVIVGSKETSVDVPTVRTKKESVSVPVIGVSEGKR